MQSSGGNSTCNGPEAGVRCGKNQGASVAGAGVEGWVGGGEVRGRDWGGGRAQNMDGLVQHREYVYPE